LIDFRYYLVSIVAIFFALAIGIVLGSGPLEGNINNVIRGTNAQLAQEKKDLQDKVVTLQDGLDASQTYAGTTAPLTLDSQLGGQTVALVVLPGAAEAQVSSVDTALSQAGARVGSVVRLTDAWSDPTQQDVLGRVADGLDRTTTDSNASVAAGQALADALVSASPTAVAPADPAKVDPQGVAVLSGLVEAGFVKVEDPRAIRRGSLAVVVGPDVAPEIAATDTYLPLIEALDKDGRGVVVGGAEPTTQTGGIVAVIRGSDLSATVSTVDDLDLQMGAPTASLALVERLGGGVGQYGIHAGATDVVPDLAKR
jgi:hypothetical protein